HAVWGGDDADNMNVEGFFGDPISHGLSFKIYQPGIDRDSQFPDWFSRDSEAVLIFQYGNGKGMGLRFDGGYRLVYTGVGLEAFGSTINSTPPQDINDIQRTVLSRILRYLNFVHHTPLTDTETTEADFSIGVKVTGDISDLERVTLFYRTDGVGDFMGVDMADGGGGQYSGIIPAPMADTYVNYYIEIENSYYVWTNPVGAPTDAFSFYAGPDTVAPVVVFVSDLEDRIDRSGTDQVTTFVSDNIGIDEVQLVWTISSEASEDTVLMTFDGNLWTGQLTWDGVPGNTVITYQIVATDVSTGQNVGWSDPKSFKIVNRGRITGWEDESIAGWDTGDSWGLELKPDERGYVMDDFPYENYLNNANNILTRIDPIDVSPYNSAYLSFLHVAVLDSGKDFGFVELSNNGTDWTTVATITGLGVVRYEIIDVSSYINEPELRLRFRMTSDDSVTFSGWSVDDVYLLVDTTLSVVEEAQASLPEKFSLEQNYPNPFNPTTTIAFSLPRSGNVELVVYDLLGREVATLLNGWRPAGRHEVVWNASAMATGVYLYRLKSGDFAKTKKLLLLK
ncbi:MAG: T9SS type A sorting domain-containing protein, partial [Fidelibacterota bacterium]